MGRSGLFTGLEILLFSTAIIFSCLNEFRSKSLLCSLVQTIPGCRKHLLGMIKERVMACTVVLLPHILCPSLWQDETWQSTAKCHWTQPRICAQAASELLKWASTASFVPSEHEQREFNSSRISEINSCGNSTERKILVI